MNLSTAAAIIAIASNVSPAVVLAGKTGKTKASKGKAVKSYPSPSLSLSHGYGSSSSGSYSMSYPPQDQICPCWTPEDLDSVTEDNVISLGLFSCNDAIPFPGFEDSLAINSSAEEFLAVGAASSKSGENECSALERSSGDSITEIVSDEQFAICSQQIVDRCAEIGYPVTPSTCPCFSEADLLAIDEDNVTEGSCLIDPASQSTKEVVLSNGDVTYTYTLLVQTPGQDDDVVGQCSSPSIVVFDLTAPEDATCQQLILSRCADIGAFDVDAERE